MKFSMTSFFALLAVFWSAVSLTAQALPVDGGNARVDLVADQVVAVPGSTVRAALVMDIDEGWHVYWQNPGDSGLPPEILWSDTQGAETGPFSFPLPHPQPIEDLMNYGFEDKLVLPFDIVMPAGASGEITLEGEAHYLICKDICIPEKAKVSLRISVGSEAVSSGLADTAFEWAQARLPMALSGDAVIQRGVNDWRLSVRDPAIRAAIDGDVQMIRFFPLDHQIEHPPVQPASFGTDGITLQLTPATGFEKEGALAGVLVIEDVAANRVGFTIEAQPGEVLAETSGTPVRTAESAKTGMKAEAPLTALSLLGILAAALLGGAILNLMPCVLPVLFIKARSLLTLAGHDNNAQIRQHGLFYTIGVIACFVAFGVILVLLRAGGEQIGLGFQLQIPMVVALLALLIFVLGLNMIGMFEMGSSLMGVGSGLADKGGNLGAFFTGVLAAFVGAPCIGPFIGSATAVLIYQPVPVILLVFTFIGLGMALPFALLSFFPALFRMLPKPGPWMERLKQFFAFPLFLTAIWLLSVLGSQLGTSSVILTGIAATLITFGIWFLQTRPDQGPMRMLISAIAFIAILAGIGIPVLQFRNTDTNEASATKPSFLAHGEPWSQARVAELRAEGRPVFVDFTASWCVTCLVNKSTTLTHSKVKAAFEKQNVAVLVADWTRRDKAIGEELARYGRAGVPLYLYYPADGREPDILPQVLSPDIVVSFIEAN